MGKNKLQRFQEIGTFKHVFEPPLTEVRNGNFELTGKWNSDFFENNNPLILELGCGKGEYTVQLGKKYPEKNFIGIDIKGARIWRGAKTTEEEKISNVAFVRTRIDFCEALFAENEVDEIWITFPDPQPQKNRARKRLTSMMFLNRYKSFLKKGGLVHLKTDSDFIFNFTLDVIKENNLNLLTYSRDIYSELSNKFDHEKQEILSIKTFYEQMFLDKGENINYLCFQITA